MVSQRKRSLLLGLGLSVALVLVVGLPATASAVSTLTGETLNGSSSSGNSPDCLNGPNVTYSVSGTASGSYPGTFEESGTIKFVGNTLLSATFKITSGTTTITGTKSGSAGSFVCFPAGAAANEDVPYTATIHTPNGDFHDEGVSTVQVTLTGSAATLTETYTSSLAEPVLIGPDSKDQCKNNGWKAFPQQFKNQGQCVSFVERQRRT
jgi:hypothetical protein